MQAGQTAALEWWPPAVVDEQGEAPAGGRRPGDRRRPTEVARVGVAQIAVELVDQV